MGVGGVVGDLVVLVVEDEPEVRAAIVRDLGAFTGTIRIDESEDVVDALAALDEADAAGDRVGLIVADHRLPGGASGVDLLVTIKDDPARRSIRTMLVTGQAGHQDTIRAINEAGLDHYFAKPWDPDDLVGVAKDLLTSFVIESDLDLLRYARELDGPRLMAAYADRGRPE